MPQDTVKEAQNYPIPENTLCHARLTKVELFEKTFVYRSGKKAGQEGVFRKWEWYFEIVDGEYQGLEVRGNTEPGVTNAEAPQGDLHLTRPWYETLLGRELTVGEAVDTDVLLGLDCQITVAHQEPREREGGGFWFNIEVEDVFPYQPSEQEAPPF